MKKYRLIINPLQKEILIFSKKTSSGLFCGGKTGLTQLLELLIEPGRNLHMFNGEFLPYITAYVIIA